MSAFWVWLRFASVERNELEVRSRSGGARPQGLAWTGSPRFAYHLVPQNEAMLLMPPLSRSANAACLAVTALATATRHCVLFDDMWSIANRHSSVQVFVHDHSLSGQSVPSAGSFQLKHSIVQGNDVVLVHGPLMQHTEDPIEIFAPQAHKRTAFLGRRYGELPVELGDGMSCI